GLGLSEANYDSAIQILQEMYGQCKIIATRNVDCKLIYLYHNAIKIFRQLENLNQNPDNFEFGYLIEIKPPRKAIEEIYSRSSVKSEHISARELLQRLQVIVERTSLVDVIVGTQNASKREGTSPSNPAHMHVNYLKSKNSSSKSFNCYLCGNNGHSVKNCLKVCDICDKYNRLLEKKRSIRCSGNHLSEDCSSKSKNAQTVDKIITRYSVPFFLSD
ncbi:hypothetical protein PMAYCL1PPCAC_00758, partial [Pristionchus mayeri]